jgi:hypothetical protein
VKFKITHIELPIVLGKTINVRTNLLSLALKGGLHKWLRNNPEEVYFFLERHLFSDYLLNEDEDEDEDDEDEDEDDEGIIFDETFDLLQTIYDLIDCFALSTFNAYVKITQDYYDDYEGYRHAVKGFKFILNNSLKEIKAIESMPFSIKSFYVIDDYHEKALPLIREMFLLDLNGRSNWITHEDIKKLLEATGINTSLKHSTC